jgi:hypothetical protein
MDGLLVRRFDPFPFCSLVCGEPPTCRYRFSIADLLVGKSWWEDQFRNALRKQDGSQEQGNRAAWELAQDAAYQVIEFPNEAGESAVSGPPWRAACCAAQQLTAADSSTNEVRKRATLSHILSVGGLA